VRAGLRVTDICRRLTVQRARGLRLQSSATGSVLWNELRNRKLRGIKFRRQQPLGPYIVDFYAPQLRLAVEVDGPHHEQSKEKDLQRQHFLEQQGVRFLRIPAVDIDTNLKACVERIAAALCDPR